MEKKIRNRLWLTGAAIIIGSLLFCSGMTVGAATNEPGSAGDPLITRSYLEERLKNQTGSYQCITMKKGETFKVAQGAQLIVYTGTATVVGNLIDITEGSLAGDGTKVQKYHSYLAPADGSGFTAAATCVIFFLGETK